MKEGRAEWVGVLERGLAGRQAGLFESQGLERRESLRGFRAFVRVPRCESPRFNLVFYPCVVFCELLNCEF